MKSAIAIVTSLVSGPRVKSLLAAGLLSAGVITSTAQISLLVSFTEETKIKGRMTPLDGALYAVADKGGAANYGYIGRFDPAHGTWSALYEFSRETKVKGGLMRVGDALWFVCEKGGAANVGFLGSYNPAANSLTVLTEFPQDLKPKTAPVRLDDRGWYFFTDRGGTAGLGALVRFETNGTLTVAASFDVNTGVKFETPPVVWQGQVWYAAREGGDLTQVSGKGAGAVGTVDLDAGTVVRQLALVAAVHGAKIRALVPFQGRLYYAAEEGGDPGLNNGKGYGGVGWFDPNSGEARLILVCDGPGTGAKPRDLVVVGDALYFVCAEGGSAGGGTLGRIRNGTVEIVASLDADSGARAEALTPWEGRLYLTTELGGANWFGGIAAHALSVPGDVLPVSLIWQRSAQLLELRWSVQQPWILESAPDPDGPWSPVNVTEPESGRVLFPMSEAARYFRLRYRGP
ncbi:hypothetical protein [Limisphaera sp. VF-2]|jgi:hypothetical protein|uniref:hypothetical protein n=1 Tax=Limisphaera sp. VF-2 TaxID=3400418 RepID=UPI00175D1A46